MQLSNSKMPLDNALVRELREEEAIEAQARLTLLDLSGVDYMNRIASLKNVKEFIDWQSTMADFLAMQRKKIVRLKRKLKEDAPDTSWRRAPGK